MQQIEIDFEVYKALTAKRRSETHTYNEVIRELLDLDVATVVTETSFDRLGQSLAAAISGAELHHPTGMAIRGIFLPNGTRLRATYKGQLHEAEIINGKWSNGDGRTHRSPSAAAQAITRTNVNGWRFWQAKRPSDTEWRLLDALPKG